MYQKSGILIFAYFLMGIVLACGGCCRDVQFFDFGEIALTAVRDTVGLNDSLAFRIEQIDIQYLGMSTPGSFGFATVQALNCDEGWGGMKWPIETFELTSDADFDAAHPAGAVLNDLVTVNAFVEPYVSEYQRLEDADISTGLWSDMYIIQKPTLESEHRLSVLLIKSNGDTLTASSEVISWQ